jgi:hypothetical protein
MASKSSNSSLYDWNTNHTQLALHLMTASEAETLSSVDSVVSSLSSFIDPLITVTNHPLLKSIEFYDASEILLPKLNQTIAALWNNAIFKACYLIALTKAEENEDSFQSTADDRLYPIPPHFYWLKEDQVSFTLEFLRGCRTAESSSLKDTEIKQCEKIYSEVQEYLQALEPILNCPAFKNRDFHFALNFDSADNPELANKIETLFLACITAQAGFSRNSPLPTPEASPHRQPSLKSRQLLPKDASMITSLNAALKKELKEDGTAGAGSSIDQTEKKPPEEKNMLFDFLVEKLIAPSVETIIRSSTASLTKKSPYTALPNQNEGVIQVVVVPNENGTEQTGTRFSENPHFEGKISEKILARENIFEKLERSDGGLCGCNIL